MKPLNLKLLVSALNSESVEYVLIGGLAVIAHGADRATKDIDIAIAFDVENRHRLVKALEPLHPRPLRLAEGAAWVWDVFCIRGPWTILETDAGRVDLIVRTPGVDSFSDLFERAMMVDYFGVDLRLVSLDDLMRMKAAATRDVDVWDLHALQAVKRILDQSSQT